VAHGDDADVNGNVGGGWSNIGEGGV